MPIKLEISKIKLCWNWNYLKVLLELISIHQRNKINAKIMTIVFSRIYTLIQFVD